MQTPHTSTEFKEWRRRRAWELYQAGWRQKDIASALDVSPGAVSQWITLAQAQGSEALAAHPPPGAACRLTDDQLAQLPSLLAQGAEAHGFRGNVWTRPRIAALIKQVFGVTYHRDSMGRILKRINWTLQQPVTRATQQDPDAVAAWHEHRWPDLKKTRTRRSKR